MGCVCTFYLGPKMRELTIYYALSHSWVFFYFSSNSAMETFSPKEPY